MFRIFSVVIILLTYLQWRQTSCCRCSTIGAIAYLSEAASIPGEREDLQVGHI